jgi:predicted Zn-dependent protease
MNINMDHSRCADLFREVRRHATAGDIEVTTTGGSSALTRFANNGVTQNVAHTACEVSVRVQMGGRTARATTNLLDADSLRRVVQQAEELTRVQEEDATLPPMLTAATAAERAAKVEEMVAVARRDGLNSAGTYSTGGQFVALFNSHGVERWHQETLAQASVTMQAADSSGWQKQDYASLGALDVRQLAETAAEKALRSAHPIELEPGDYTVILEPSAVVDLIGFLAADFSALALLEQRSSLNQRLGTQLFGENISIVDDSTHPLQLGEGFDGEGVARRGLTLVEQGRVTELAVSRGSAARVVAGSPGSELEGKVPACATGHGFPLPNEAGEGPQNVVFRVAAGSARSTGEMIAATERGLLVTRLWYIREVDAYEKILTGMTRDGTFLVEDGRLRGGIWNLRFNQGVIAMLKQVMDLGVPVRACGEESFPMVVPAMRVAGFHFTETTCF